MLPTSEEFLAGAKYPNIKNIYNKTYMFLFSNRFFLKCKKCLKNDPENYNIFQLKTKSQTSSRINQLLKMSVVKYYTHVNYYDNGTADFKIFKLPMTTIPFKERKIGSIDILPIDIDCAGEVIKVNIEPWIKLDGLLSNSYTFHAVEDMIRGDSPESKYTPVKMSGNYFNGLRYV